MDKKPEEISKQTAPPTPIDEFLTMSTESDTWTLVKGNRKALEAAELSAEASDNRIDELQSKEQDTVKEEDDEEEAEKKLEPKPDADTTTDDLSDGISVISDSESGGRISPHPFLREHLADLNKKFSTGDELYASISQSRIEQPNDASTEIRHRHRTPPTTAEQKIVPTRQSMINTTSIPPIIRRGFTGIFYVCILLAILAFVGKLRSPEWTAPASSKAVESFEQKLNDMELQNNLMRAEIDILSKQVNFLSTLNEKKRDDGRAEQHQQPPPRKEYAKTFKAWQGNGNSMDPIQITKADLKRPYKCPDNSFVEVGGMCIESPAPDQKSLLDEMSEAVNDVLQQSETYRTIEKVAEKLSYFTDDTTEHVVEPKLVPPNEGSNVEGARSKGGKHQDRKYNNEKPYQQPSERYNTKYASSKERGHGGRYEQKDNGRQRPKTNVYHGAGDSDEEESHERFDKKYNSKERFSKYEKHGSHRHDSHKDGGWQDKLMRHREEARRQHEIQRNDKNWYIKRGDSRERVRRESGENVR